MFSMGRGRTLGLVLVMGVTLLVFVTCGPRRRPGQAGRPTATPPALATVEATRPPQVEQVEPTAAPTMTAVSTMTAAPTLAADPTPAGGEAAGFPTLNNALSLMTLNAPDALCNDGSPARYYFRQGQNNKWLVFLEGGGACFDSAECDTRRQEQFNLTSSTRWEETMPLKGIFSNDPERNPGFWNWNQVYVKYCSSDAWSGKGLAADGRQFRGRAIIQGVLNDLERHPQFATGQGTDSAFILAGCSGGGQGVMQNLDDVALRLAGGFDDIRGINDAGWAIDVRPSYAGPDTPSFYDKLAKGFSYWSAGLDQSCVAGVSDPITCYFGATVYPFVTTPVFAQLHQREREQISSFHSGTGRNAEDFAARVRASFENVTAAFSPAGENHCVLINDRYWGDQGAVVNGFTMQELVTNWVQGREPARQIAAP